MPGRCSFPVPTPKEGSRLSRRCKSGLACYLANLLHNAGTRTVARQQHVKVIEMRLLETLVQLGDLLGRSFASFELFVSRVIAWSCVRRPLVLVASWPSAEAY
jgi:hypothetical protein